VTIHSEHPFLDPEPDPVRRFRGRLGGVVTLWTCGSSTSGSGSSSSGSGLTVSGSGLTVSSLMVANGSPAHVLALLDPDSSFLAGLRASTTSVVQLLGWGHRDLADAFAGVAPAPGGPFRMAQWRETEWGPVLADATTWAGVRLAEARSVGWSELVDCVVEHVEVGDEDAPLVHRRGRYLRPD
jgi:flavin reductase (DIM6/NTAB) family NADH-FMN oxidoreductase RutF